MDGPGSVFKNPLPGSTNYLSAYDKTGELLRVKKTRRKTEDEDENEIENEDGENEGPLGRRKNLAGDQPIPREHPDDLIPFPLNPQFKSQPVLSEELKDEIYKRIVLEGQSVQVVSAELQVEMRRVGAVVRLKSVEKQWVDQVSLVLSTDIFMAYMMKKTFDWSTRHLPLVTQMNYNSLIKHPCLTSLKNVLVPADIML